MRSRAAILHDVGGPWSVEEFDLDPPRAGEVLVEMAAAGLCHSDDHILKGDLSAPNEVLRSLGLPTMFPMIGGHEGSGIVRAITWSPRSSPSAVNAAGAQPAWNTSATPVSAL
jgi:Zn-dependent alcohol dehydrogenase